MYYDPESRKKQAKIGFLLVVISCILLLLLMPWFSKYEQTRNERIFEESLVDAEIILLKYARIIEKEGSLTTLDKKELELGLKQIENFDEIKIENNEKSINLYLKYKELDQTLSIDIE
ncbi:hypothetical protein DES36_11936 [Alkalibaculum bacchi]|uniref:Uncharacterized protein n=1 Tax=Alkalibaculum bacchi TaxID=645887 RepID=A0A366HYU0_9FIRM|nr:hypothetical protein [Alkalibaculum bacchi]RBP59311.1 hypothetical protein DES36_11936 [Alkalibaculum bacchi]